jgi:hypothetical protein
LRSIVTILKKIAITALKMFGVLFLLFIIAMNWYELPIGKGAVDKIYALVNPDAYSNELPSRVEITIDGATATFYIGTPTYNQFVNLLRRVLAEQSRSDETGLMPDLQCGEMVVHSFGIPFHFRVYRSSPNHNYYWIRVPCPSGMTFAEFYDDGKLLSLIHNPSHTLQ